jgi:lysophospholipase L1-like esterase
MVSCSRADRDVTIQDARNERARPRAISFLLFAFSFFAPLLLAAPVAAQSYRTWYLAEGATGTFFDEDILLANPNPTAADIRITYFRPNGPPVVQTFTMAATSRKTVRVDTIAGLADTAVSAVVECTNGLDIVVERSMYWANGTERGGHNALGVNGTSTRWYLAEGATGFFEQFILISNPDTALAANVRVTYLKDDGTTIVQTHTIAPSTRFNIWVNASVPGLASAAFSTLVESTNGVGLFVERAMYWGPGWEGGHGAVAVTAPQTTWRFAEGFTGAGFGGSLQFDTFLLLGNPGATAANVRITYFRDAAPPIERTYTVAPTSRLNIFVDAIPGLEATAFSAALQSTNGVPIIAERAEYWGPPGSWVDGHNSPGVTAEALKWGFAEGVAAGTFDTYILVVNSTVTPLSLHATFMREDGTGITKDFQVPPQSRFTIVPDQYPELRDQRFATFLESTNGVTFVAERAVYWGAGYFGGHGSPGVPWSGTIATPPAPPATPATPPPPPPPPSPPVPTLTTDRILAFGDSVTEGYPFKLAESYPARLEALLQAEYPSQTIDVENAGFGGERTDEGRRRLPGMIKPAHDLVIILEGYNGLNSVATNSQANDLRAMVQIAKDAGKQVILSTLTPIHAPNDKDPTALNARIRSIAADEGAVLVDLFAAFGSDKSLISSDGLHPSRAGYQRMAEAYFDAIVERFGIGSMPSLTENSNPLIPAEMAELAR